MWNSEAFPEKLMMTLQEDSVKRDREATGIPGLLPFCLLGTIQRANHWVYFCIYSGIHCSRLVFQSWVLLTHSWLRQTPQLYRRDWGANAVPSPAPEACQELSPSPAPGSAGGITAFVTSVMSPPCPHPPRNCRDLVDLTGSKSI